MKVQRQQDDTITLTMEATAQEWDDLLDAINAVGRKSPDQKRRIADFSGAVLAEGEGYLTYEMPEPGAKRLAGAGGSDPGAEA
jgi:hypothetical protein